MPLRPSYIANLECGHSKEVFINRKTDEYCWKCQKTFWITKLWPRYYLQCASCRYARSFGVAQYTSHRAAVNHQHRFPNHHVRVYAGGKLEMDLEPRGLREIDFSVPPF